MNLENLMQAANKAKVRTGRKVGTQVKQGKFQVVDVVFDGKGTSTVTPLSDYLPIDEAIEFLKSL